MYSIYSASMHTVLPSHNIVQYNYYNTVYIVLACNTVLPSHDIVQYYATVYI